jgi:hypothetical protein
MSTEDNLSRRDAAVGLLTGFGILTLSSCTEDSHALEVSGAASELTGTSTCWVDTIANLRVVAHPATSVVDSKIAVLHGYFSAYDGGGGVFCWDHTAVTENNGTLIRPTDVPSGAAGRWRRLDPGPINVKWFGAKGDGSTVLAAALAEAAAIQEAINHASAVLAGLFLPAGTYFTGATTLTTPTTSGGKLRIAGAGKRITKIARQADSATNTLNIKFTGPSDVEISDLSINGPASLAIDNQSVAIDWSTSLGDATHRLCLNRVEVTGKHSIAVQNSGGGRVEVVDSDLEALDGVVCMFSSVALPDGGGARFLGRGGTWKTPNGDPSTGGSVGLYIHPHIPYIVEGVTFEKMGRYGIYQNGSWTDLRGPAVATGCRFIQCEMAQTKGNGVSDFVGCVVKGTTSQLGSKLSGRVNVTGCTFENAASLDYGAGTFSKVSISGCLFVDTPIQAAGNASSRWSIRDTTVVVTDNAPLWLGLSCVDGGTDLENITFVDETTRLPSDPNQYQTFVRMTVGNPSVRLRGCRFRNGRGSLTSGIYQGVGALVVEDCEFAAGATPEAIWVIAGMATNALDGDGNRFTNGAYPYVPASTQQTLIRRRAQNPATVASATTLNVGIGSFVNFDTHVVTGTTTIQTLATTLPFVGVLRLIVAAGANWATSSGGNITPKTVAARTPGSVVELLWEPIVGKWLEV